ncbi:MAG TPA: hypothetical protein VFY13_10345 [Luteolibacter sp.]|nr:hypothetical protein [Luteolibacter sp.]
MDIEAIVKKHLKRDGWSFSRDGECAEAIRAALTEAESCMAMEHNLKMLQVEAAHAIELRAYEATVENLAERIRQLEVERAPEGWKLVPVDPTDKMIGAGIEAYDGKCETSYRAMLAAVPQQNRDEALTIPPFLRREPGDAPAGLSLCSCGKSYIAAQQQKKEGK